MHVFKVFSRGRLADVHIATHTAPKVGILGRLLQGPFDNLSVCDDPSKAIRMTTIYTHAGVFRMCVCQPSGPGPRSGGPSGFCTLKLDTCAPGRIIADLVGHHFSLVSMYIPFFIPRGYSQ